MVNTAKNKRDKKFVKNTCVNAISNAASSAASLGVSKVYSKVLYNQEEVDDLVDMIPRYVHKPGAHIAGSTVIV